MKLYEVEFNGSCYKAIKDNKLLQNIPFEWEKTSNYPEYKYNIPEEEKLLHEEYKKAWDLLTIEEVIKNYPDRVELGYSNRKFVITLLQYESCYSQCEIKNIIDVDGEAQIQAINLEELANKISDRLGTNLSQLKNQKLEIHQPNMPLFTYNNFHVLTDSCTELLQNDWINKGWRVVCVCPQPDQRRPDYILGKYTIKGDA